MKKIDVRDFARLLSKGLEGEVQFNGELEIHEEDKSIFKARGLLVLSGSQGYYSIRPNPAQQNQVFDYLKFEMQKQRIVPERRGMYSERLNLKTSRGNISICDIKDILY